MSLPAETAERPPRVGPPRPARPTLRGHLQILRVDHWFKGVFMLPGTVAALSTRPDVGVAETVVNLVVSVASISLVASSNYVINELQDAPYDRHHPTKHTRPVPSGTVNVGVAYGQWIALMVVGVGLALVVNLAFAATAFALWLMGCVYNLPPVRSKDVPYLDVLSEAVNNPLRMMAGWFAITTATVPPLSLLLSYWMIGCYFMAIKRFAEHRNIGSVEQAARYRRSLAAYNTHRLLVTILFYASAAMLFFGAFIVRYRLEFIGSFPLVALIMALYLSLAFRDPSPAEHPEQLYREPYLVAAVVACAVVMTVLLFVDLPWLRDAFSPGVRVR